MDYSDSWVDLDETTDSWGYGDVKDEQAKECTHIMAELLRLEFPGIKVSILRGMITSSRVGGNKTKREQITEYIEGAWLGVLNSVVDG